MNCTYRMAVVHAALALAAALTFASSGTSADPFMPPDALERGMKGYGLTVFQGTRIDTFQVEIIGVLENFRPKADLVLARISGGPLGDGGVLQGMSGSPVYVDGKLVGAVSYSLGTFAKEPIAGITPIAEMTGMWTRPKPDAAGLQQRSETRVAGGALPSRYAGEGTDQIRPIGMPLVVSGLAPQLLPELREELIPLGLIPVQGGSGSARREPTGLFGPGAAMGVQLARGDVSMTAIGTLTYREGDRTVGFGHPAYWIGATSMPMTGAYIHDILLSGMQSYKLGVATGPVGVIDQDRAAGVSGRVGPGADMLPTEVRVRSEGRDETFRMEVWRHRDFAPFVVRQAAASALFSAEKPVGRTTLNATARYELKGRDPVNVSNVYSGPRALGEAVLGMTAPLARVMGNPFQPVRVEHVLVDLKVAEHQELARISGVRLPKAKYRPGDLVTVHALVRPEFGDDQTVETRLAIPAQVRSSRLMVRVSSSRAYRKAEAKRVPGAATPGSLDQLLRHIQAVPRNDQMIVELVGPPQGVSLKGRELRSLPPSVLTALSASAASGTVGPVRQGVLARRQIQTDYVLSGSHTVIIAVDGDVNGKTAIQKVDSGEQSK